MEMADMLVINKADGDNVKKSELAKRQYENALHIFPVAESGWTPVVRTASALKNIGIPEVWNQVLNFKKKVDENGYFNRNRDEQQINWMYDNVNEELKRLFYESGLIKSKLQELEKEVVISKISPLGAASQLIDLFKSSIGNKSKE